MKAMRKGNNVVTPFDLTSNFQGSLYRIGPGRAGKLKGVFHLAWLEDDFFKLFQKRLFGLGGHIQAMYHAIFFQIINQLVFEHIMVMTVIECPGATTEIDISTNCTVIQKR